MKNFVQPGDVITVTASGDVASGSFQIVGIMFGIAATAAKAGEEYELKIGGVYDLPKTSAQAWTLGAAVYWDADNHVATTVATDNTKIGVAAEPAANPTGTGRVRLNMNF